MDCWIWQRFTLHSCGWVIPPEIMTEEVTMYHSLSVYSFVHAQTVEGLGESMCGENERGRKA